MSRARQSRTFPSRVQRALSGARAYVPAEAGEPPLPCLIFIHGGGFMIGDLDSHDSVCRQLADGAGCKVIALDYRLAPEHKFPAAVEDALAATRWTCDHAGDLDIDPARIAIGGDSAGGNLSAVVSNLLGRERLAFQLHDTIRCGTRGRPMRTSWNRRA